MSEHSDRDAPEAGLEAPAFSNDHAQLTPVTTFSGHTLRFSFPSLMLGVAQYDEGPTGCLVLLFEKRASVAVDVRGGSHGTLLTDERDRVSAICLAGGSLLGIEAATGVTAELFARRGYKADWSGIPLVSAGIIYDYGLRNNTVYPDKALGRAAVRTAQSGVFPMGAVGAGASATVGKGLGFEMLERGGQGGAFRQVGPTKVAVLTVVNAVGAIVDRSGKVVRGHLDSQTGERYSYIDGLARKLAANETPPPPNSGENTTLTVVVTNQRLNTERGLAWSLRQFARTVHGSMNRAIQPFHTAYDGDVLWAVTTEEVDNPDLNDVALGVLASEVAWDAVLNCYGE